MPARLFADEKEHSISQEYLAGMSARALARKYNTGHRVICEGLARQGVAQRSPSERNRLYAVDHNAFDVIDNEAKAYWYGFIFADGCVTREKTLLVSLAIKDYDHVLALKDFLQCDAPVKTLKNKCGDKWYWRARFETTSRHLAARLIELGVTKGRPISNIWIYKCPWHLWHHWLRGYFDGDGSAHKAKPGIGFLGRHKLLCLIRYILAHEVGRNPILKITKHNKSRIYYLTYTGINNSLAVANYLYRDATIWLERKRENIDNWPEPKRPFVQKW